MNSFTELTSCNWNKLGLLERTFCNETGCNTFINTNIIPEPLLKYRRGSTSTKLGLGLSI